MTNLIEKLIFELLDAVALSVHRDDPTTELPATPIEEARYDLQGMSLSLVYWQIVSSAYLFSTHSPAMHSDDLIETGLDVCITHTARRHENHDILCLEVSP